MLNNGGRKKGRPLGRNWVDFMRQAETAGDERDDLKEEWNEEHGMGLEAIYRSQNAGSPNGIRTRVAGLKSRCPRPA